MDKKSPRHFGGSLELKEGTGPIIAMCPCGEFLEIYKVDRTFRVQTPETIDPEETNPNAPFLASPVDDVGSSNPIVARVLLQGHEILKSASFDGNVDEKAVIKQLHSCKESLVASEKLAKKVASSIDLIAAKVSTDGISQDSNGRALNPFPQVQDLDADCGAFLIHANRAIKSICALPQLFLSLERADSNFDFLATRLSEVVGNDLPITNFVRTNAAGIRYLIDLRNFHEHPKEKRTVIDNFRLMPDMTILAPTWHVSDQQPAPIRDEMFAAIEFLIRVAEAMLIHLVMLKAKKGIPLVVIAIDEAKIDVTNPIRYRLSIDAARLRPA